MSLSLIELLREPQRLADLSLSEWDRVLRLARAANLLGRIAAHVQDAGLEGQLPPQVARQLLSIARLNQHQREAIAWECQHLALALQPLGIPLLLLKGAAYAMAGLPAARGRLFGDVDLLVPRESLNAVEAALMLKGWLGDGGDPYDQRYYRQWMHELPPMMNHQRGTVVDVHHNILPLSARSVPDARLLLADSVAIAGSPFRMLSPCDRLIHSATHLFHEGELRNGLRDLYDLDSLWREGVADASDFGPALLARAEALGLAWPVHLALRYTAELLGTPIPAAVRAVAAAKAGLGPARQRLLDACYRRVLAGPEHPLVQIAGAGPARAWLYLRGHALRMPPGRLALHLGRKALLRTVKHSSRKD